MIGGLRPRFTDDRGPADLAGAAERSVPPQLAAGLTSFCFNPSQYADDAAQIPALARDVGPRAHALASLPALDVRRAHVLPSYLRSRQM